ncbi:SusC/RagA family TonB-linked outer membrane protein [Aquimarina aquimarini]|uniref:SusC/RagA family TonB-linked outer membrane protein n=1 Tax=Aquimarina aquimarini TaxID=1191734 RepID=UPI000D55BAF7|nr:TonB-dependent receptor [Aquimarina aquimarini]
MKVHYYKLLMLFFFICSVSFAQEKDISGTVTDDKGLPLPGVNVLIKNTSKGTQTDFDGNYVISANRGAVISFSYVGFTTNDVVVGDNTTINIKLAASAAELEEVVVTAYGVSRKSSVTSAISTVGSEDLQDFVPSTSIDNILQGQAAGVQVTASNGRPGNTAFVQIRGVGSLNASTTPLYVIDGVPIPITDNDPTRSLNPLSNLNPNDIESLSILKDAASVSKYGSRGANGVVLITTKKGKKGDAKIKFTSSYGFGQRIADPFDLMNAEQKLEIERQYAELGVAVATRLPGATSSPQELRDLIALDTDWEEELLRKSVIQSNSLSISGANDKINYFFSLGYNKDTGIIDRIDGFERITARLNTSYQAKDWLGIDTNISFARSTTDLPRDRNNVQNPFRGVYDYNPYEPLFSRDANGGILLDSQGNPVYNPTSTSFPIARALQTETDSTRDFLIIGNVAANLTLSDKFSNRFSVGLVSNRLNRTRRSIQGGVLQGFVGDSQFPGTQTENAAIDFEYNIANLFSYNDTFNDVHNISASFLLEYNENIRTDLFVNARGFPSPDIPYIEVAAEPTRAGSEEDRRILFSQAIFADYDYDGRYIASFSVRRDGSSKFGPDNKYGTFASGSVAWNIAKESFMDSSFFNDLKLRASYGTSGNQNIPDFQYLPALGFENSYNGFSAGSPLRAANPLIQWESQAILDIGVEFGFFNNRINGVVDYFKKNSKDLLLNRPISFTVGDEDNGIFQNIGEVENSGVEFSLNADVIRTENFTWSLGGNLTILDTKVKKLINGQDIVRGTFGNIILREGENINSYYLVEYAGVNPANGAPQYVDLDGNITETYSDSFQKIQKGKTPIADLQGGFFTSLKYKGFGIRGDFVYRGGNYILNSQRQQGEAIGNINRNLRTDAFNYWKEPGDTNVLPSPLFRTTADQAGTTRFLEKGDFIRLRTLTLDYNMPRKFLDVIKLDALRFFVTGQNIWTITDYNGDPEIGIGSAESGEQGDAGFVPGEFSLFSYPQVKSYTFGVEVGF